MIVIGRSSLIASALLIFVVVTGAAKAQVTDEPEFDVRAWCQRALKDLSLRGSPCAVQDARDGVCHEFPEAVEKLNKLLILRETDLLAYRDCPAAKRRQLGLPE